MTAAIFVFGLRCAASLIFFTTRRSSLVRVVTLELPLGSLLSAAVFAAARGSESSVPSEVGTLNAWNRRWSSGCAKSPGGSGSNTARRAASPTIGVLSTGGTSIGELMGSVGNSEDCAKNSSHPTNPGSSRSRLSSPRKGPWESKSASSCLLGTGFWSLGISIRVSRMN